MKNNVNTETKKKAVGRDKASDETEKFEIERVCFTRTYIQNIYNE